MRQHQRKAETAAAVAAEDKKKKMHFLLSLNLRFNFTDFDETFISVPVSTYN